jgi:uncharacterized protein (DUF1330 family)
VAWIGAVREGGFLVPKGYVIFTEDIHDEEQINAYGQVAIPTILQAGGQVIVVDDAHEKIEGTWHGTRTVVLEFESVEAARNWYGSAEYQGLAGLRHAAADSNAAIVAGFEMPAG